MVDLRGWWDGLFGLIRRIQKVFVTNVGNNPGSFINYNKWRTYAVW